MTKTKPSELILYLRDELAAISHVETRRFFGGWEFRANGKQFAIVMKDTLFFRVDDALRDQLAKTGSRPFFYTKGGKRVNVEKYYSAPEDLIDDTDELCRWASKALKAA